MWRIVADAWGDMFLVAPNGDEEHLKDFSRETIRETMVLIKNRCFTK